MSVATRTRSRARELLWVVPKWPLPAQDGARMANCRLIEGLVRRGHLIDLVAFRGPEDGASEGPGTDPVRTLGVRKVFRIERPGRAAGGPAASLSLLQSLLLKPWLPVTFRDYATRAVARELGRVLEQGYPGAGEGWFGVVYDGLHPAIHSSSRGRYELPRAPRRVIYRAHNFEADLWRRKAAQTGQLPFKLFLQYQAARVLAFERSLVRSAAGVAPVSPDDWSLLSALSPSTRGRVVPIGYDFGEPPPEWAGGEGLDLLFVGRLDWPPNREGLAWFLEKVWHKARRARPELRLSVVGSGDGRWLGSLARDSGPGGENGVRVLGRVDDLAPVYGKSLLSIVPIFYGSGTRVKVIESSRFGRACLSTALGVEGTGLVPGRSFLHAETEQEWIDALARLDPSEVMAVATEARERMRERFDLDRAAEEFERLLNDTA